MINYGIIDDSIKFYETCGFPRIESPWTVTHPISDITKPPGAKEFTIAEKQKVLVASGEQSFLALYNKGFLPKGRFQTVTPCFRDESFTPWHTKYFIKNELIMTDDTSVEALSFVVDCAREFFRKYCLLPKTEGHVMRAGDTDDVKLIFTTNQRNEEVFHVDVSKDAFQYSSYDLVYRGVELGSYGIRKCGYLKWIYGTGVAEPRLSRVLEYNGIS